MRTYGIGRSNAYPVLEKLGTNLTNAGFIVPRFIREFGVYDSQVSIDGGWLEPEGIVDHDVGFLPPLEQRHELKRKISELE